MIRSLGVTLVPVDFWHFHYLVYDLNFYKLGTVDFKLGFWFFTPVGSSDSFFGFSRFDAVRSWQSSLSVKL